MLLYVPCCVTELQDFSLLCSYNLISTNQLCSTLPHPFFSTSTPQPQVTTTMFLISTRSLAFRFHLWMRLYLPFCSWLILPNIIISSSIHTVTNNKTSSFFCWVISNCAWTANFLYPFISRWTPRSLLFLWLWCALNCVDRSSCSWWTRE